MARVQGRGCGLFGVTACLFFVCAFDSGEVA